MTYTGLLIAFIILIAAIVGLMFAPRFLFRERPTAGPTTFIGRENYGPPPGAYPAVHHDDLDDRGWPERDRVYEASTASAISHMIERSA